MREWRVPYESDQFAADLGNPPRSTASDITPPKLFLLNTSTGTIKKQRRHAHSLVKTSDVDDFFNLGRLTHHHSALVTMASALSARSDTTSSNSSLKIVGIVLAIVSGVLIGSSFVFKKKGLLRAQAGGPAGEGVAYLKSVRCS